MEIYEILILVGFVSLSCLFLYFKFKKSGGCGCGKNGCCQKKQDRV